MIDDTKKRNLNGNCPKRPVAIIGKREGVGYLQIE